jgi:hypothetical protein
LDIVITVPKLIKWENYKFELARVKDRCEVMNFRLGIKPNVNIGDKCFVVHDGKVRGWMEIVGIKETDGFTCTTTGRFWPKGIYIQRSGEFNEVDGPEMQGFQGFRYAKGLNVSAK